MLTHVVKRDNTREKYDGAKIKNVLEMAFKNSDTIVTTKDIVDLVENVTNDVCSLNIAEVNIEDIQNFVEKNLMKAGFFDTAKHYIEYRIERQENRITDGYLSKIPDNVITPWGMLGYITYKRTYARAIDDDGNTEEYRDTIMRILRASQKQLGVGFTNEELKKAYYYLMSLKCSVAGRFAWQLGTTTVDRLGLMSLQNCAFVKIDEPINPFLWIFDVLMLGTGVGFSIEKKYVDKLPPIVDADITVTRLDTKDADFIIPDSREGWVSLLEKILEAYFYKGKSFTYSTLLIRSAGSKINGFGGVASGPEDLVKGLKNVQTILSNKKGQQLTTVDCLDIVNIIATIVVAGNVRRCLPAGSLVHTKKGMKKIECIDVGDKVMTSHGYDSVGNVFKQGKQNVITIITQDGEFKCTPNHKMAILTSPNEYEWKEAQYLKNGDLLMTSRRSIDGSITRLPESEDVIVPLLDEYVAWFVGMIRSVTPYENIKKLHYISYKFSKAQYKSAVRMKDIFYKFVDSSCSCEEVATIDEDYAYSHDIDLQEYSDFYSVSCKSIEIYNYINENIMNCKDEVPSYIMDAVYDIKMSYIAGIIDGNIEFNTLRKDRVPMNIFTDESLDFVKNLQNLCYSCGFETRLCKNTNGIFHKLNVITNNAINSLLEIKLMNKLDIVESYVDMPVQNINSIPSTMLYSKRKYRIIKSKLGLGNYKNISIDIYDEYFDTIGYCPVKVISVDNNSEVVETYDIEVSKYHEFYCNGYLTHNSALIALGDYDDIPYLKSKDWAAGNIPNWRCMSNNSVVCDDIKKLPAEFWEGYNGTSEPYGLINLDLSRKIGRIKDGEKYPDPDVVGYNPCFAAETLIAVADGRGAVPIEQLANENKDVPVYSVNEEGMVEIKWGRHPRMTGVHQKMVKVTLDNGTFVKTTLNHKFRLKDGSCVEAKDLKPKMSLTRFVKTHAKINKEDKMAHVTHIKVNTDTNDPKKGQVFEHTLIAQFHAVEKIEGRGEETKNRFVHENSKIEGDQYIKNNLKKGNRERYSKWCEEMMQTSDLETYMDNGILHAKKTCENCKNIFSVPFSKREIAYCSLRCSNTSMKAIENRRLARNVGIREKQKEVLHNQIMAYKDLQESLGRDPIKKEWENECKSHGISYRIRHDISGNEFLLRSYQDLKDKAAHYNHRVKSVEFLEDAETVYNITVDDNHTVGLFTTYRDGAGDGIFTPQCGEISTCNFETCCLSEIYLSNITSFEELKDIATTVYRICKHSLLLKCHQENTEAIVHKNMRMGIGITGYMQSSDEQKSWLNGLYEYLREYDNKYSDERGIPRSIKLTTVKPSGTLSLLAGVTSGCHPAIYQYFKRRIRIASNNSLIKLCRSKGYFVEYQRNFDGTDDTNTMIIEFPCCYPEGTKLANDMTAIDQLETIKELQNTWSDNSVSCTIYYRLHELDEIKQWLAKNYQNCVKTCSFLLHNDHGFQQAPFEEITKDEYEKLKSLVEPITRATAASIAIEQTPDYSSECVGGACPIR